MDRKISFLLLLISAGLFLMGKAVAQDDVADVPCRDLFAGGDRNKRYFLIGAGEQIKPPEEGFGLVIVLPGGDGGPDFNPFVKRIYKNALSDKYLVVQLVAVRWTSNQKIVWPTEKVRAEKQKFSTEEFVEAVVRDIKAKHKLNEQRIFTLSWSSGGPAAYVISLQKEKSVTGSYVAMSVFKPNRLGNLEQAAGHSYFIDHSPEDKVCPFRMAKNAARILRKYGARTRLVTYKGGHGWQGNVYGRLREGIGWLELNTATQQAEKQKQEPVESKQPAILKAFPIVDSFEVGRTSPAGWQQGTRVQGVEYIWDKETAFEGKASLCMKKTARRFFPIAQWARRFTHDGTSQELQVSVQIKAEEVAKAVIDVQFLGADRKRSSHQWAAYIGAKDAGDPSANHNWRQYEGTVSIPEDTKWIIIALQIYGPGTVWFDELRADYVKPEKK